MAKIPKINATLINEINKVEEYSLDAYKSHMESVKTLEAWGLNPRQQCKDEITDQYHQFIDPRSCLPIKIYASLDGDKDTENDVSIIAAQTEDEEMTLLDEDEHKDGRLLWLGIGLAGMVLVLLIAILMVFKSKQPEVIHAALQLGNSFIY